MQLDQLAKLQTYDLTPAIEAIDQAIAEGAGLDGKEGPGYKFKVSYQLEKATKGDSNIVFNKTNPDGKVSNILTQKVVGDELWPHKPSKVVALVRQKTGMDFTTHHHQLAWKKFGARPRQGAKNPSDCKKDFCHYHTAHNDYTYSDKWVEFLSGAVTNPDEFAALKAFQPKA
jgi:hypothetical protein